MSNRPYDDADLSSLGFWRSSAKERERTFAELREHRPVSWHRPVEQVLPGDPDDPGFWAVVRHADITEVSVHNEVFCSGRGVMFHNAPREIQEATLSFLSMDPPRHTKIRKLISASFTPRRIERIGEQISAHARAVVAELGEAGDGADFVVNCSARLPILVLSDMMGIPPEDHATVVDAAESMVSVHDPVFLNGRDPLQTLAGAVMELHRVAHEMAAERRARPHDDLMSNLVAAEVDGERLTDDEIAAFFVLLTVAGNDTTRQTTSHALWALTEHPLQRDWLMADFDGRIASAVEEFVRWATPVMTFRRTAVTDTVLAGTPISAGDKVVMFYPSGNRDAAVFADPYAFDLSRQPNPHVGFGGGGAHFCLGAQLARAELRAIFRELLHQLPKIEAEVPDYVPGPFIHSIRTMRCHF